MIEASMISLVEPGLFPKLLCPFPNAFELMVLSCQNPGSLNKCIFFIKHTARNAISWMRKARKLMICLSYL